MARIGAQLAPIHGFRRMLSGDPFSEMFDLQRSINHLFENRISPTSEEQVGLSTWTPAVDVYEDEKSFVIKAEIPGVSKSDVKVNLNENVLSITGERKFENEEKRENYHRVERRYGQFYRSFTLPPNVNAAEIAGEFKDGILRVTLPKKEEAQPKQIDVKVL